jgi:preprotein translocase subunit SecA
MPDGSGNPQAAYAERLLPEEGWLERQLVNTAGRVVRRLGLSQRGLAAIVPAVLAQREEMRALSDEGLREAAGAAGLILRREGLADTAVARAFALTREAARRTIGLEHYDVQLLGGRALLAGVVAEMATGEGKTLTATLTAATAALAGWPVHVVTVNDYLAGRDAQTMAPVYRALGLTVGCIQHDMDGPARRLAYASDVTYCSNKEIAFDYLRDRVVLGQNRSWARLQIERLYRPRPRLTQLVMRGLHFAIVDEADSVLIDEARTPLILSREERGGEAEAAWQDALDIARQLEIDTHFRLDAHERRAELTSRGEAQAVALAAGEGRHIAGPNRARDLVALALTALHCFARGQHYVVRDGKVQIVDEYTGRLMPDRSWEGGLHQLIELKEGCEVTPHKVTMARMSYQRFFRRYRRLAGMTGTAAEVATEFWSIYRLPVVRIPTHRPCQRKSLPPRVYPTAADKWAAVVAAVRTAHDDGRPVLVGTRSVTDSEQVSELLTATGIGHRVLNAMQDCEEAEIIAGAGAPGMVTVATNMAGRGTDIHLGAGVEARGGLAVICTQPHDARRIDRQLFGRSARQGDRGSAQVIWSLEDELALHGLPTPLRAACLRAVCAGWPGAHFIAAWLLHRAQRRVQARYSRVRRNLVRMDERGDRAMAFAGQSE